MAAKMSQQEYIQAVQNYYNYMQMGMRPSDAFNRAFPNGVPTKEDQLKAAAKAQESGALAQVGGTLAGLLGAQELYALGAGKEGLISGLFSGGSGAGAQALSQSSSLATPQIVNAARVPGAEALAGTEAAGTLGSVAPYLGVAGAGLGAYGLYNAMQDGSTGQGALSGAALGSGLAAAAPLVGLGPVGWGGLALAAALGAGGGAGLTSIFSHKPTKEYIAERWGDLQKKGITHANTAFQANHPGGADSGTGTWDTGKYAGQKWTFDKALDLTLSDPTHFQHVYGNYDTFGNDWAKYNDQQQKTIVDAIARAGLYEGNKGDVLISDKDRARQLAQQALGGPLYSPQAPITAPGKTQAGQQLIGALAQQNRPLPAQSAPIPMSLTPSQVVGGGIANQQDFYNTLNPTLQKQYKAQMLQMGLI